MVSSFEIQHCISLAHLSVQLLCDGQVLQAFWQPIKIHRSTINTTLLQEKQWRFHKSLLSQQTVAVGRKVCLRYKHVPLARTNTCTHRLTGMSWEKKKKTHASKHTPEKATVNEPRSRPKRWHQSGTLTLFGSRRTVSRICQLEQVLNNSKVKETILCISAYTASERAKLVGSLPHCPYSCCLLQLCKLWNDLFLLNDSF